MTNTPDTLAYNAPNTIDPHTGELEQLGMGRIAVLGEQGVARVVTYPETNDVLDILVAEGSLSFSA